MDVGSISINIYEPDINLDQATYNPTYHIVAEGLQPEVTAYSHTLAAFGGFDQATITLKVAEEEISTWLESGLNRHVLVYNPAGVIIWEGFVDSLEIPYGALSIQKGSLLEIVNRISVAYTRVFTDISPPVTGGKWVTTITQDIDSQKLYGILEEVYSSGSITLEQAEIVRDVRLQELKNPKISDSLALSGGSTPQLQLNCKGYYHRLGKYIYEDTNYQTRQLSTRLTDVLLADPNGLWGSTMDTTGISANAFLVAAHEDEERYALDVIRWLVSHGDVSLNRFLFGVYAQRRVVYEQAPTDFDYAHVLTEGTGKLESYYERPIAPWDVRAGKWIKLSSMVLRGSLQTGANLRTDPTAFFAEEVEFTAPNQVTIQGSRLGQFHQLLAQYALEGTY